MSLFHTKHNLDFFDHDILLDTVQGTSVYVSLLKPAPYHGEITHTFLENIWLDTSKNNATAHSTGVIPKDKFLLGINRKDMAPVKQSNTSWTTQSPLFFMPEAEMDFLQWGKVDVLGLTFDGDFFEKKIVHLLEPESLPRARAWCSLSPSIQPLHAFSALMEAILLSANREILQSLPHLAINNLEETVALAFADIWQPTTLNQNPPSKSRINPTINLAVQVRNYMHDQASEDVRLTDICAEFCVSKRTLQYIFANEYGISPMKYLQLIRLNRVHRQLLEAPPKRTTVTHMAMSSGFWHMGNFSKAYKHLFGESPSHTLQRTPSSYYAIT